MPESHPNSPLGPGEKSLLADLYAADQRVQTLRAQILATRDLVEAQHPVLTNVTKGCCAPPKLCNGHADECGGSHDFLNRPPWPCRDLRALREALKEIP
ncbi:hypothetical protein [Terracoccus sp. 273MFTsu3.1]|uniref:hypothetical protein n=1 Tax=Terracoccus sp. 273MFTsu3.1 TaxID=1172188 RepID=UPI00037A8BF7|nr:hypothetical protein [Terracoccus sp. 273MFTsu3.1]